MSAEEANGVAVEPRLGLPRDLRIDGESLPADSVIEGTGATRLPSPPRLPASL
ncbi:hypothetical protein [Sorangium sp. So ce388]|uniref:hypothetical protein n=1 Tax=Sorangium sp. So ce388 TaxID=3133309 RepID=UPI003F5C4047